MTVKGHSIPLAIVLLIVAAMLLPGVLTSFEMNDTGFYLTFYDNFYTAPGSVEYNFMCYLTGLIGGAVTEMGDWGSMLRVRLFGLLFLLCSAWIAWRYPRHEVKKGILALALITVFSAYSSAPIILNYDIVSVLLISVAVYLLTGGIINDNRIFILLSGFVTGVLLFARIPNLLQFFLIILIPIYSRSSTREKWLQTATFVTGYFIGILSIFLIMASLGHTAIFNRNINTLLSISSDSEASHGLGNLIISQMNYYLSILKIFVKLALISIYVWLIWKYFGKNWIKIILAIPAAVYFGYMAYASHPVDLIGAIVLPGLLALSFGNKSKKLSVIAAGALLSSLIMPLGSDFGGRNIGSILYLLGAAPALSLWMNFNIKIKRINFFIPSVSVWCGSIIFITICLIKLVLGGLYFDNTPIWAMDSSSSNIKLAGIKMSRERAEVTDEIVSQLSHYVQPGDTLFAFGSSPMLNYLTSTRPWLGLSWPELVSASRLEQLIGEAESHDRGPVVCVQRFNSIGSEWGTPSDKFVKGEDGDTSVFHSAKRWLVVDEFLKRNNYTKVPATSHYDIYLPEKYGHNRIEN